MEELSPFDVRRPCQQRATKIQLHALEARLVLVLDLLLLGLGI